MHSFGTLKTLRSEQDDAGALPLGFTQEVETFVEARDAEECKHDANQIFGLENRNQYLSKRYHHSLCGSRMIGYTRSALSEYGERA